MCYIGDIHSYVSFPGYMDIDIISRIDRTEISAVVVTDVVDATHEGPHITTLWIFNFQKS